MVALRVASSHVACFIIHVLIRAFADASNRRGCYEARHSYFLRQRVTSTTAQKGDVTMLFQGGWTARKITVLFGVVVFLVGCETRRVPPPLHGTQYGDDAALVPGSKNAVTMHDLEAAARSLMAKLRSSSAFASKCKAVKDARSRFPLIIVGGIDNRTGARIQDRLDSLMVTVRSSLFETDFLEVKDDEVSDKIKKRIQFSADGGLETGDLVQFLGGHDAPDFIILGDLRQFEDAGIVIYKLHLAVHSFATGLIAWEGVQTIEKL